MKQKTILLGLSGGVDSAVAALLLQKQGYTVIGAFMRCFSEFKNKLTGECPWVEDHHQAQKIAALLGIKFIELNYEREYAKYVIKPMFRVYKEGRTPNPDADCNTIIKFPFLRKAAKKLGCKYVATGHYVKKIYKNGEYHLHIPKDHTKDQTYFLYGLTQEDLKMALFPIGDYTKKEVRNIAKKYNFPNWNRHGTRGLCFVGNIDMKEFLKQKIKQKTGDIISPEGNIVGVHQGTQFYTIGERIRENPQTSISNEHRNKVHAKLYVAGKDTKKNELLIAPENHTSLFKKEFTIKKVNWISGKPSFPAKVTVRIRHLGQLLPATITKKNNTILCTLQKLITGIAPGQSAVLYTKTGIMLGGGEINY